MKTSTIRSARLASMAALMLAASAGANAAWVVIPDADLTDTATNPDSPSLSGGTPTDQSASALAAWLQDLLNLASPPSLLALQEEFSGASITGVPSGAQYITLHYGNLTNFPTRNATIAYMCSEGDCSTFTGYSTSGLSNYRIFGTASSVPEPATLGLLGAGLMGLGLSRRRRKS